MPYISIYIHIVFTTKNRFPFLDTIQIRKEVWKHIFENAKCKNIHIDMINGYCDHCHILLSLKSSQNISQVLKLIKGESSRWINESKLLLEKFEWQNDYYAISVSNSHLARVRNYIKNQEAHHSKSSLEEEIKVINKVVNDSE